MSENQTNSEISKKISTEFTVSEMFPPNIPVRDSHPLRRAWTEPDPKPLECAVIQFDQQTEDDLASMGRKRDVYYVLGIRKKGSSNSFAFGTELKDDETVGGIFEFSLSSVISCASR